MIRVADYIIEQLVQAGIKHIFLITGRGILYLTDAVAKNNEIQGVSTYHEQGASYAAMAYAAANDGMSACLISTGCAASNAVTAALCAYQDNLPVVFISGQNMLKETTRYTGAPIRTYGSQEADIIEVVESITKYSVMLTDANQVGYEMSKAISIAQSGRKGPVWIDVPLDIQNSRVDETSLLKFCDTNNQEVNSEDIKYIKNKLLSAKRPIVFIGGGVRNAGAEKEIKYFIEKNRIPLVYSTSAADIYGSYNELSLGAVGSLGGSRCGNFAIQNADYILAIGTKLTSQSVGPYEQFGREATITVVDIDPNEHKKNGVSIDKCIIADAKKFLDELGNIDLDITIADWLKCVKHWKDIFAISNEEFVKESVNKDVIELYHFADTLSDCLPNDATVITDAGFEELIIPSTVRFKPDQRCLFPAAQGAMGYAIPAIIGAYHAGRNNIITIVGDGSFMMNMQELQIVSNCCIPAKIFIINNNMYAVIRKRQKDLFRTRTIGNDPSDGVPAPDFKKIADCFGIEYRRIESESDLTGGIQQVIDMDKGCICEVMCEPDQKYLHMSFAFTENRKMIKRPLEDMSPFISRELFKNEMIINALEE